MISKALVVFKKNSESEMVWSDKKGPSSTSCVLYDLASFFFILDTNIIHLGTLLMYFVLEILINNESFLIIIYVQCFI